MFHIYQIIQVLQLLYILSMRINNLATVPMGLASSQPRMCLLLGQVLSNFVQEVKRVEVVAAVDPGGN